MAEDGVTRAKRAAAQRAVEDVETGTVVGLGTGSTAAFAIAALGEAVADGLSVQGVPTSLGARQTAIEAGIPVTSLDAVNGVDVAIDGADQVAGTTLLKGGGAAHAREKAVDAMADRFIVVVDDSKLVETLTRPVPLEVLPGTEPTVRDQVKSHGATVSVRTGAGKDGPVITDNGNLVLDCDWGPIQNPAATARTLASLPGVVEHGLFVEMADQVIIGAPDGTTEIRS